MHQHLQHLAIWTYAHPQWAGLILFLISICETITVIGLFIPGTIILTVIGALIGAGLLPYVSMVLWAAAGALLGDSLNFILGYYLRDNLAKIWPFSANKTWLDKGKSFFQQHGRKSVFLGRFLGPLRAFIPVTAGALHMPIMRFLSIDALSAVLWAAAYVLPGILLGAASLELPTDLAAHYFWFILMILGGALIAVWLIRLSFLHVNDVIKNALTCLWQFMLKSPSFKRLCDIFRHYRKDHPRGQLSGVLLWILLLLGFMTLAVNVWQHGDLTQLNEPIYHFLQSLRTDSVDNIMIVISCFGDKRAVSVVFIAVFLWFCYRRCWRAALHWALLTVLSFVCIMLVKHLVHFSRPPSLKEGFSFPSGHTTLATVLYGGITYFITSRWPKRWSFTCYSIAITIIGLIALSRLYLGMHWLTDVTGSVLLGSWCLVTMAISYQRHVVQKIKPTGLLIVTLVTLLCSVTLYDKVKFNYLLKQAEPIRPQYMIQLTPWWQAQAATLPLYATNRFGQPKRHFNIQWASNESDIQRTLIKNGWHTLKKYNWVTAIQHPESSHHHALHFKTLLFQDSKPGLTYVKTINQGNDTLALQLWETNYHLNEDSSSLWAGILSVHPKRDGKTDNSLLTKNIGVFLSALDGQSMKVIKTHLQMRYNEVTTDELVLIKPKKEKP